MQVEWIPCKERMPTPGKKVWAWCTAEDGFPFWGHWNWRGKRIWVDAKDNGPYPVSHWAKIDWPEAPKEEA